MPFKRHQNVRMHEYDLMMGRKKEMEKCVGCLFVFLRYESSLNSLHLHYDRSYKNYF